MQTLIQALFAQDKVITENSSEARQLYEQSVFGHVFSDNRIQLSFLEALYLVEKGRLELVDSRGKPLATEQFRKKAAKKEANFWTKYVVFRDLRSRGYVVKTALKFGADFRVYERGMKPGQEHAKWIVFPVHEGTDLTWQDYAAKNRVAHSTKKRLLIAVVDDEGDVSYWESRWLRP